LITGEIAASAAAAYEGALGRYRRATDQSALEASRDEFQLIARGDSARAGDAQGLLAEINAKNYCFDPAGHPGSCGEVFGCLRKTRC